MSTTGGTAEGHAARPRRAVAVLERKIKRAVTDSGGEVRAAADKPGITNLLEILSAVSGEPVPALEARFAGGGYGAFKSAVADAVVEYLRADARALRRAARRPGRPSRPRSARGAERARAVAVPVMDDVRERSGLVPRR